MTTVKVGVLVTAWLLIAPAGIAETGDNERDIGDQQLRTFIEARAKVRKVLDDYSEGRQEAANQEALEAVRLEMQEAMASAVTDTGMSVARFNELTRLIRRDRELRERVDSVASNVDNQAP